MAISGVKVKIKVLTPVDPGKEPAKFQSGGSTFTEGNEFIVAKTLADALVADGKADVVETYDDGKPDV